MKTHFLNFAAAALIVLAAASCNKEEIINTGGDGTKAIALSISIGEPGTKAAITPDAPYQNDYSQFERLDIYFTNPGGNILYHWSAQNDAQEESDGKIIWDGLVGSQYDGGPGVKFLGLSNDVTAVYVVANVDDSQSANGPVQGTDKIDMLNEKMLLTSYSHEEDQDKMPYAGADNSLQVFDGSIDESAGEISVLEDNDPQSEMYVKADIHLRPAISRIEVEEVGAQTAGTDYFVLEEGGNLTKSTSKPGEGKAYYSVSWENFDITLVGVYMSNVYRKAPLFPASSDINPWQNSLFETPVFLDGESPITGGKWTSLSVSESAFNEAIVHSNYESDYGNMVPEAYRGTQDSNNNTWLYTNKNQNNNGVIPFNFFVPYNVTDNADEGNPVAEIEDAQYPKLHFQFIQGEKYSGDSGFSITEVTYTDEAGTTTDVSKTDNIYQSLTYEYNWQTALNDGTSYANVVGFIENENDDPETQAITLQPGYIYKLKKVLVNPTNLNAAPTESDIYNIYVVVDVIPFKVQNVYPVFE